MDREALDVFWKAVNASQKACLVGRDGLKGSKSRFVGSWKRLVGS